MLIMIQMSVTHSNEPAVNYHYIVVPLSSVHFSIFQLVVLVLLTATLQFWLTLIYLV